MSARAVLLRHRARPGARVELRGEMVHWFHPIELRDAGDGWLEAELSLAPGVYEYKLTLDDETWLLDPDNPRTRARDGVRNSVLSVGGTDEPILHAPARPWVYAEDDGRVCVRAALRRDAGDALALRWDEGDGPGRTAMTAVAEEDEHRIFEAHLPGAGRAIEYRFVLEGGRCVDARGHALRVEVEKVRPRAPAWWRDAAVYTVLVDRFRRGGRDWSAGDPGTGRAGGDLDGVAEALDHLVDLGITAVHLTPVCAAGSAHRYDAIDPRRVDPALGGEPALERLLEAAHARGLRILLDVAVTHVHRDFFAFRDVRERGPDSPYWSWFQLERWPLSEGYAPGYRHYPGQWQEPLLHTADPAVADYLVETFVHWARLGVDGFRIDACADVPAGLTRRICAAVEAENPDAAVFAEIIPASGHTWTAGAGVHAATDFAWQDALHDWLWRRRGDAGRVAHVSAQRRAGRGGPGWTALAFSATHDQPRLRTLAGAGAARLAHLAIATGEAIPLLYYGDEVGLASDQPDRRFEDAWPDRMPMPWDPEAWDADTHALVRAALRLRRERPALRHGDQRPLPCPPEVLAYRRRAGADLIDVYLNGADRALTVALDGGAEPRALLSLAGAALEGGVVRLPPGSGLVVDRTERAAPELALVARELATRAIAAGSSLCPALPTHLYVTVTEACNLRCAHCITGAPERTRSGRARELAPWVIEALRPALAGARYLAFTHGGEALVSPRLPELLATAAAARPPGARCDVHLATNGMLLDQRRLARLVELGLTSVMVSLDGATAATNDRIRAGARFERVVANLRAAVAFRARTGADLRLGISTVAGASNLEELGALGELALDLGVDWLKIEETYPATPFARLDLVRPGAPRLREQMDRLRQRLGGSGVVLVDHLAPPPGCRCDGDAAAAAFRDADDFANRFAYCGARAAWDQACIDPDGTVRPVSYAHEPVGELGSATLEMLWNRPVVRALRERSVRDRAGRACA
jgi:cyclomaltodextrinase / maltogenic alpha-amylase / neopullulanase